MGEEAEATDHFRVTPVSQPAPSFFPTVLRVERSAEKINALRDAMDEVKWPGHPVLRAPRHDPGDVTIELRGWPNEKLVSVQRVEMLASEALHHLRASLDYLAHNVVWRDSQKRRQRTAFPLCMDQGSWPQAKRSISGMLREHEDWVKAVQPFNGVQWSTSLSQLSNEDKHWAPAEVTPVYLYSIDHRRQYLDPDGDPEMIGYQVDDYSLELRIAPMAARSDPPDWPLAETVLREILGGVVDITNRFLQDAGEGVMTLDTKPDGDAFHAAT